MTLGFKLIRARAVEIARCGTSPEVACLASARRGLPGANPGGLAPSHVHGLWGPPATELACHPRHGDPDLFVVQALTGRSISNEPHCLPLGENAWLPDRGWSPLGLPELGTRR